MRRRCTQGVAVCNVRSGSCPTDCSSVAGRSVLPLASSRYIVLVRESAPSRRRLSRRLPVQTFSSMSSGVHLSCIRMTLRISRAVLHRAHRTVRQRAFIVSEQYGCPVRRTALPGGDDPRQRRHRAPRAHDRTRRHGSAGSYAHGNVRLDGQIAALTTDAAFAGGDYIAPPEAGLSAFGMVWAAWLYSQQWWREELWRSLEPDRSLVMSWMNSAHVSARR